MCTVIFLVRRWIHYKVLQSELAVLRRPYHNIQYNTQCLCTVSLIPNHSHWQHNNMKNKNNSPALLFIFWVFSPCCCYLVFHLIGSKPFIEEVHNFISLVTTSSAIKAGDDYLLCASQVGSPVYPEAKIWFLATRPSIAKKKQIMIT